MNMGFVQSLLFAEGRLDLGQVWRQYISGGWRPWTSRKKAQQIISLLEVHLHGKLCCAESGLKRLKQRRDQDIEKRDVQA